MQRLFGTLVLAAALAATVLAATTVAAAPAPKRERKVVISVTKNGFEPATVRLRAGEPVRLVVTRNVQRTCATEIVVKDYGIHKPLPLGKPVEVRFTPKGPGAIRYACGMDMIAGRLVVE